MDTGPSTRQRLIDAMVDALQRRGLHGVGVAELLELAQAPKGVLYHHFPGGKTELAVAAIDATVARLVGSLDRLSAPGADPAAALRRWLDAARAQLESSGFDRGCPLATVALESGADDLALRDALARGFDAIRASIARAFVAAGIAPDNARPLAALVVSAYEGGLLQARVAGAAGPMLDTTDGLLAVVRQHLPGSKEDR